MRHFTALLLMTVAVAASLAAAPASADVLLDRTTLIGLPAIAAPSEYTFTASTAQALTLTLTDLKTPAAFASLQVAVTLGDTLIGSVAVDPTTHMATLAIPAAAGNYTLRVIGTPDPAQGFGSFGACVAPAANVASCITAYSFSGNIQTPATASSSGTSTLNTNFTSTVAGTYTVTLTDDAFPVALQSLSAGIFQGSTPLSVGISPGAATQLTLAAGTSYQLLIAATAAAGLQAGLYGVRISDPSGAAVFDYTLPVGTMKASTVVDNTAAQSLSLNLTDYAYPSTLASLGAAITAGSKALATLTASGSVTNFMATAGTLEVWQFATAGAQPGTYSLTLSPYPPAGGSGSLLATTQVVNPPGTMGTSYAFVATVTAPGTYNLVVNDFQFPSAFPTAPTATVAQNGAVLVQSSVGNFTAAQGTVIVLVSATPPAGGSGIFGVTVQTSGASPQILLDQTQAVGGVFDTQTLTVGVSGSFDATLADLGFPANFQNLAVVVSQASEVVGKIYGSGTFSFNVTPGVYVLTFVATPGLQGYGLYSVRVSSSPPSVTFTAASSSVNTGQPVQLTWSAQNATSCNASGSSNWTGSQATSGSTAVIIDATVALMLTCTGAGGSAAQSVTVTATSPPAKSGGGSLDWWTLAVCFVAVLCRQQKFSRVL
jgi:hypothetical protein